MLRVDLDLTLMACSVALDQEKQGAVANRILSLTTM